MLNNEDNNIQFQDFKNAYFNNDNPIFEKIDKNHSSEYLVENIEQSKRMSQLFVNEIKDQLNKLKEAIDNTNFNLG